MRLWREDRRHEPSGTVCYRYRAKNRPAYLRRGHRRACRRQHGVVGRCTAARRWGRLSGDRASSRCGQAPPPLPRGVRGGPLRALTERPLDGRHARGRRRPEPPVRRRAVGHPPVAGPDRHHDPTDESQATRTPPSPSRSRPRRDHGERRHPRHHPRPHAPRPRRPSSSATSSNRPSTRPNGSASKARTAWQSATRPSEAPEPSERSPHPPTPNKTSRPASTPSSMTAVSRGPRPTPSSRGKRSTSPGRTAG